jgi:hypothetical protein
VDVKINGIGFVFEALNKMREGVCGACGARLPSPRVGQFEFTCNKACHDAWIDRLVAAYGETKILTLAETGKRYVVPTRTILEHGIDAARLVSYPEAM